MKLLLAACLLSVVRAQPTHAPIVRHYHESYGIQQAAFIKAAEEAVDFDGSRIVGGGNAVRADSLHVAGFIITLVSGATSVCGGSVISATRLITAANCWWDGRSLAREMVAVMGSTTLFSGGTRRPVNNWNFISHPDFDTFTLRNNIAVVVVAAVTINNDLRPIIMATQEVSDNADGFVGTEAFIRGFGITTDSGTIATNQLLRHAAMTVRSNTLCVNTYGPVVAVASTLCAEPTTVAGRPTGNVCYGDTGGSLTQNGVFTSNVRTLIGVISFWSSAGCQRGLPSGFTRISSFTSWIQAQL